MSEGTDEELFTDVESQRPTATTNEALIREPRD